MIIVLLCLLTTADAFSNISKNIADIYSTLEADYEKCLQERSISQEDLTLPKAVILRDKIKSCIHVGNELILMAKERPHITGKSAGNLYKSENAVMKADLEKVDKFLKSGGHQHEEIIHP